MKETKQRLVDKYLNTDGIEGVGGTDINIIVYTSQELSDELKREIREEASPHRVAFIDTGKFKALEGEGIGALGEDLDSII